MADPRIIHIELDEATILWRNADIEQERRIAIFDLIEDNTFKPCRAAEAGHEGPYRLRLSVDDGRLILEIADGDGAMLETLILGLGLQELSMSVHAIGPIKRLVRRLKMHEAEDLVQKALVCTNAEDVHRLCQELVSRVAPEVLGERGSKAKSSDCNCTF